jgi:hypothetical protein
MIDNDGSGFIDGEHLALLLRLQGIDVTKNDVMHIIRHYHRQTSQTKVGEDVLSFEEFCAIMDDGNDGNVNVSMEELTRRFANKSVHHLTLLSQMGEPLWKQQERESGLLGIKKGMNARMELGKLADGTVAQGIILVLIVVDVVVVIMELLLAAIICLEPSQAHRRLRMSGMADAAKSLARMLAGTTVPASDDIPEFCIDCMTLQIEVENVLHWVSVSILFAFAFQIFLLMVAYGLRFFKNPFFVLDFIVVVVALVLELAFHVREGALFAILLSWRVIRIIHGFYTTIEIQHKENHKKIHNTIMAHATTTTAHLEQLKGEMTQSLRQVVMVLQDDSKEIDRARLLELIEKDILDMQQDIKLMEDDMTESAKREDLATF